MDKKRYVWMVVSDGTCYGEYENAASACLFATEEEAISHVESSLREDVVNGVACETGYTDEMLEKEVGKWCKWYGKHEAQFRHANAITDYKIERLLVPEPKPAE